MAKRPEKVADSRSSSQSRKPRGSVESAQESNARRPLAKSADPAYMKFTTYIRKSTHRGVKTRLVSNGDELSVLVEELLSKWLKKNNSFNT